MTAFHGVPPRLLAALTSATRCVRELQPVAAVSTPALSHRLNVLRDAGLLTAARRGRSTGRDSEAQRYWRRALAICREMDLPEAEEVARLLTASGNVGLAAAG